MHLLHSNPPQLSEQLERRTNEVRSTILKTLYNSQFAQTASEIAEFRHVTGGVLDGTDDTVLSELFRKTVQFTSYDAYEPLVARFFEEPCKQSAIDNLFAPGVPDYLVKSSSTSGGAPKWFPKYQRVEYGSWATADPARRRTNAFVWSFGLFGKIDVQDKDSDATTIYLSYATGRQWRSHLHLDPEKDEENMATFILDHTTPYAVGFIGNWRSFLLIHVLFALRSKSLETVSMCFITSFVEMMRYLDTEFDTIVDCIANGTIPELDGITNIRHHLELNVSPDPERATELRNLGPPSSRLGWCSHAWPNLRSVQSVVSGSFASSLPLARDFLGPNINLLQVGYASTEVLMAVPYDPLESNQYKLRTDNIFEFLDVSKSDSIDHLVQPWEVEVGRRYEPVATTQDGLWRYRIGDVVEIAGFDATDGVPIIKFSERRNTIIRLKLITITEAELRATMSSVISNTVTKVVDWTATIDERCVPATVGFFIEFSESPDQVPDLSSMTENVLTALSRANENIPKTLAIGDLRPPTIWIVRPGTFSDFRQFKLDEGSSNVGQIKVPVVLPKPKYVTWFLDHVVQEL